MGLDRRVGKRKQVRPVNPNVGHKRICVILCQLQEIGREVVAEESNTC